MKKSPTFWNLLPVLLIILGLLLLIFQYMIRRRRANGETETEEAEIITVDEDEPEPDNSREARIINNYKVIRESLPPEIKDNFAKILTAQAMHETGVFTSRLYKEQNNLFGMTQPVIRETLSTGGRSGFANYATLEDSVRDLLLYFKEFNIKPASNEFLEDDRSRGLHAYLKLIKSKDYFEAPYIEYFNAVRKHLAAVKNLVQ